MIEDHIKKIEGMSGRMVLTVHGMNGKSYGKAQLITDNSADYKARAIKLVEILVYFRSFYYATSKCYQDHAELVKGTPLEQRYKKVSKDIKHSSRSLVNDIYLLLSLGKKDTFSDVVTGVIQGTPGEVATTAAAHIVRLGKEIDNNKGDLLTFLTRDLTEIVVGIHPHAVQGRGDIVVVESDVSSIGKWLAKIETRINDIPSFVAAAKSEFIYDNSYNILSNMLK